MDRMLKRKPAIVRFNPENYQGIAMHRLEKQHRAELKTDWKTHSHSVAAAAFSGR
jgi:hypothetical protein